VSDLKAAEQFIRGLSAAEVSAIVDATGTWAPLPGPQTEAYLTGADITFYGGSAGGGKSDLLIGLTLEEHWKSIVFRREAPQLQGIVDRYLELVPRDLYNGSQNIFRLAGGRQIELGSCPHVGDERRFQGRPHDFIGFDEICHFTENQFRFLMGWLRSTKPGQRKRVMCTGNPPTRPEERWVVKFWAPWLDPSHPKPAAPGELRWFATLDGGDQELEHGAPFLHEGEVIVPMSRTFLPSNVEDNPFLMNTGYKRQLQSLPEPLRSQMLKGDFQAGVEDHEYQILPTTWVEQAMARWRPRDEGDKGQQSALGVDPSRGGADEFVIAPRYGNWLDELQKLPGKAVTTGPAGSAAVVQHLRQGARVNVDVIGIGSSVVDHLNLLGIYVDGLNGAEGTQLKDKTGRFGFKNKRAYWYWSLREKLDPMSEFAIALPPDEQLKAELTSIRYKIVAQGKSGAIQAESKDELAKPDRLGRSPDSADAVVYACADMETDEAGLDDGRRRGHESHKRGISQGNDWTRDLDYTGIDKRII
jgi:hypothetical protein